jgi:phosphinothricin acetyltransferase
MAVDANARKEAPIRQATQADATGVVDIYNHYVRKTVVTFEEEPLPAEEMARRIDEVRSASLPWLVAELDDHIVGYAYAAPWKRRAAYRYAVEITVYLHPKYLGRGLGSQLYTELFAILKTTRAHAVIGGIALPNDASVALHEKFGMHRVALFEEVGFKFNRWIDVGYWELTL